MGRCEDFPCCGHVDEDGTCWCPDEDGRFDCATCGRKLPKGAASSLCNACRRKISQQGDWDRGEG